MQVLSCNKGRNLIVFCSKPFIPSKFCYHIEISSDDSVTFVFMIKVWWDATWSCVVCHKVRKTGHLKYQYGCSQSYPKFLFVLFSFKQISLIYKPPQLYVNNVLLSPDLRFTSYTKFLPLYKVVSDIFREREWSLVTNKVSYIL